MKDKKSIILGLMILSFILWLITIITTNIEEIELSSIFGLASYIPFYFWLGLIIVLIVIIYFLFEGDIENKDIILIIILLSLYLTWTPYLIETNPRIPSTYVHFGETRDIIENGFVSSNEVFYHQWPGALLFTAEIAFLTGVQDLILLKILPLLFTLLYYLIFYLILTKITDKKINIFIGLVLFILGNCIGQIHWSIQNLTFFLYMIFLYLVILILKGELKENIGFILLTIINFIIICSHSLTPYIIIFNLIFLGILFKFKKMWYWGLIFLVIYLSWGLFVANYAFGVAIQTLITKLGDLTQIFAFSDGISRLRPSSIYNIYRLILKGSLIAIIFIGGIFSFLAIKRLKKTEENLLNYKIIAGLLITSLFFGLTLKFGAEIIERVVLFSIIPLTIAITSIYEKKYFYWLTGILVMAVFLFIPVMYFNESFESVQTSQLEARYFVNTYANEENIIVDQIGLIWFYEIRLKREALIKSKDYKLEPILNGDIIIVDNQSQNMVESYYEGAGVLFEELTTAKKLNKIYDNGNGEIYE